MEGTLNVNVTPEKLISTADEFNATSSQVRNLTQQMIDTVNSLKQSWEGDSATAFTNKFGELNDDMQRMHRMIDEHVADLREMANQYKAAEQANVEISNSLAGDVIS